MNYYKRIRDLREDNDKTQQEIADYLETSQTMYARYERGAKKPLVDTWKWKPKVLFFIYLLLIVFWKSSEIWSVLTDLHKKAARKEP